MPEYNLMAGCGGIKRNFKPLRARAGRKVANVPARVRVSMKTTRHNPP